MTEEQVRKEFDLLDHKLAQVKNLVEALQAIAFDLGEMSVDQPIEKYRRDGLIGITDALQMVLADKP